MLSVDQIIQNILQQLYISDYSLSAAIGTPERKIIEACAEMIAASQVDFSVLDSQHDLDSMSGGRLDAYLGNFGFGRQQPTAATGVVTFGRLTAASDAIVIPQGTQVNAVIDNSTFPDLTFVTIDTVVLASGETEVDALVQCSTLGSIGNVPAGAINGFAGLKSITGISSVENAAAMTGGVDGEDDTAFKTRFKNTIFRNMAGTYDQFLSLAVAAESVTKANVVGPVSRYQEYILIPNHKDNAQKTCDDTGANGGYDKNGTHWTAKRTSADSSIPYSKYTYDSQYYMTDGDLGASATFFRPFVDYVFNAKPRDATDNVGHQMVLDSTGVTNHTPNVTFLNALDPDDNPTGDARLVGDNNHVVLLEHAYISKSSRNDYALGILNAVDVFVNGVKETTVKSVEVMPTSANNVQNTDVDFWTSRLDANGNPNFRHKIDGRSVTLGNRLQPLYWQPVMSLPNSITISDGTDTNVFYRANYYHSGSYYNQFDGTTYTRPAHYVFYEEVNGYYGTIRARNGIEWLAGVNGVPSGSSTTRTATYYAGTQFTVNSYSYDQNIGDLQAIMEKNKQITTDVLVHKAIQRYFIPVLTIMYTPGATQAVVNAAINASLAAFFNNQYFGAAIQLSDILQAVHNTPGVDNVRWTRDVDGTSPRIRETYKDGDYAGNQITTFNTDFFILDNQLAASPDNNQSIITVRSQNTWG